jgi:uncharacterized tellurite resistance protein B-like protein
MNENMEQMLRIASQKLGVSPEQLKAVLENGSLAEAMRNLNPDEKKKMKEIMNNPVLSQKLLNSPQAALIRKMLDAK